MGTHTRWAFAVLIGFSPTIAVAQSMYDPISPNYGRYQQYSQYSETADVPTYRPQVSGYQTARYPTPASQTSQYQPYQSQTPHYAAQSNPPRTYGQPQSAYGQPNYQPRVAWQAEGDLPSPSDAINAAQSAADAIGSGLDSAAQQGAEATEELLTPGNNAQPSENLGAPNLGRPMTIGPQGSVQMSPSSAYSSGLGSSIGYGSSMGYDSGSYAGGSTDYHNAGHAGCSACGETGCHGDCAAPLIYDTGYTSHGWFGGLYYLGLWREEDKGGTVLAYDATNTTIPLLTTGTVRQDNPANGYGIRIGKMLNPCTAVEAIWWQVFPDDANASVLTSNTPGALNSAISFNGLTYDAAAGAGPQPVDSFFDAAARYDVERTYNYNNLELNFLRLPFVCTSNSCARVALLAGVRYFRADETFGFRADLLNETPGIDPAHTVKYGAETENHLVGFQLGGIFDWQFTPKLSGQIGSKFGIYNNHINHRQGVAGGPGGTGGALISTGGYAGQPFAVESQKDSLAFLSEIDLGLSYAVNCHWRLSGGYRVLTVCGYADATNQIPYDFTDLGSAAVPRDDSCLVLHGVFAGVEYTW